ncbi:MAG TPA: RcnB family protein [Sphingomicrobium sp.]|jgi:Nickel/cobalt transporter regulator|nr:RcnB family protein [Sphingomicrobium sp.]
MRKILAFMLLAGAAAPALAAGDPGDRHGHWSRSDSSESQDSHQQSQSDHHERSNNSERPHFNVERAQPPVNVERSQERVHIDRNNGERLRMGQAENGSVQAELQADQQRELQARERFRGPKIVTPEGSDGERLRQSDRQLPRVLQTRTPIVSNIPREGTQPPLRTQHSVRHDTHWTTEWRNDRRYDWRHWRDRHRSSFHLGFYYDPFGWNYRRYSIGWRLWPSYYSSSFWINDPWQYRLPYAPPGYRWIRYYDDAILVDTFSGEVVDVLYNFFW